MSQYTSPHLVASHGEEKPYHKYLLKPEQRRPHTAPAAAVVDVLRPRPAI